MSEREPAVRPPPTWRVVCLIGLLSWARFVNRWSAFAARRQKPGERAATARKPTTGRLLMLFALALFGLQAVRGSTSLIQHLSLAAERRADVDRPVLSELDWWQLRSAQPEERERVFGEIVVRDSARILDESARAERRQLLQRVFRERGVDGFRETQLPSFAFWPGSEVWYQSEDELVLLRPLAIVALLLSIAQLLQHTAGGDEHLARIGFSLEWLFSFPVRARALFLARACSALFSGQLIWPVIFPFYAVLYWCAGLGPLGLLLALAAAAYQALLAGGLRVLVESGARRYLPVVWISRLQALLISLAVLALVAGIGLAYSRQVDWLLGWSESLPLPLLFLPPSLPLWLASSEWALVASLGGALFCALWLSACVWLAERWVREGVTSGEGLQQGRRGASLVAPRAARGHRLWAGVSYKELCALLRDPRLRAQVFLTPLLVFGMQLWLNPRLLQDITGGPQHIATAAYAVASLSLTTGACSALASEGNALWLLFTAPERLEILLLHKLRVWLGVAYLFACATLLLAFWRAPAMIVPALPHLLLAAAGIFLYGVIALGIGSLGTDPLDAEPRRRVRVGSMYLFMTLSALFAYAIYTPSLWAKLVQLVLSALLAYALWQKLRDHLPYLLDPSAAPVPQIAVADGIIAALGFFVLQGVFSFLFRGTPEAEGLTLLSAFALAGLTVSVVALLALARSGVPHVLSALGLKAPPGAARRAGALALGVAAGLLAGGLALGYGALLERVDGLREWAEQGRGNLPGLEQGVPGWFLLLGVLAAPLFEELIFRGILYRGLRRSLHPASAVLASALVFALVHPALAALPVFVMAVLAAAAYERSGWLATPIAAHMTYNALLLGGTAIL